MATIYCEFCGQPANTKVRTPERLVSWIHNRAKDVVRCHRHRRASKLHKSCRTFNPLTGERRPDPNHGATGIELLRQHIKIDA